MHDAVRSLSVGHRSACVSMIVALSGRAAWLGHVTSDPLARARSSQVMNSADAGQPPMTKPSGPNLRRKLWYSLCFT